MANPEVEGCKKIALQLSWDAFWRAKLTGPGCESGGHLVLHPIIYERHTGKLVQIFLVVFKIFDIILTLMEECSIL